MSNEDDDAGLLRRVAAGDRDAFDELYRRNAPWLAVRLRRRCGDPDLAAELMQETFLVVLLEPVASVVEPAMTRVSGIPGVPTRAVDQLTFRPGRHYMDAFWLSLSDLPTVSGRVPDTRSLLSSLESVVYNGDCPPPAVDDERAYRAEWAAAQWLTGEVPAELAHLSHAEQRQWIAEVLAAARACDRDELYRLGTP